MEILGIGPFEILVILLIALIVLGPGDIAKTGRTIGRFLNGVVRSDWWKGIHKASYEARQLPYRLMRDANLEDTVNELNEIGKLGDEVGHRTIGRGENRKRAPGGISGFSGWTASSSFKPKVPAETQNQINKILPVDNQDPSEVDE